MHIRYRLADARPVATCPMFNNPLHQVNQSRGQHIGAAFRRIAQFACYLQTAINPSAYKLLAYFILSIHPTLGTVGQTTGSRQAVSI